VQKIEIRNTTQNKAVMTVIPRGARSAADLSAMAFVSFSFRGTYPLEEVVVGAHEGDEEAAQKADEAQEGYQ
jgi:hypothetical protein